MKKRQPKAPPPAREGVPTLSRADLMQLLPHADTHNRALIERSTLCGCYYCRHLFRPEDVAEWTDPVDGVGTTANCPKCGIDTVLPSTSPYASDVKFLKELARRWGIQYSSGERRV